MKKFLTVAAIGLMAVACKNGNNTDVRENQQDLADNTSEMKAYDVMVSTDIEIMPISHATAVFKWGDHVFYTDPVGGAEAFAGKPEPDFILLTDIHGDHMNAETLKALELGDTKIIAPQAVKEELPEELTSKIVVMNNGDTLEMNGFNIKAIPMYNLPQSKDAMHVKGRGNGYVLEKDGKKLYISGDTEDIPEMRDLKNIDVALISMNLPYTMPVDKAAAGVLAFQPKKVIPYHYRGKNGFSDVEEFKKLVNEGNKDIEVELMDWYPKKDE